MVVAVVRIREAIATTGEVHLKEANNVDRVDVAADEVVLIVIEAEVRTRISRRSNSWLVRLINFHQLIWFLFLSHSPSWRSRRWWQQQR